MKKILALLIAVILLAGCAGEQIIPLDETDFEEYEPEMVEEQESEIEKEPEMVEESEEELDHEPLEDITPTPEEAPEIYGNRVAYSSERIATCGEWIYYTSQIYQSGIYKIKIDGSERTQVSDIPAQSINAINNWIYFINTSDNQIMKMQIDTGELIVVFDIGDERTGFISVIDEWIYFNMSSEI
jgi:hypothetical protein